MKTTGEAVLLGIAKVSILGEMGLTAPSPAPPPPSKEGNGPTVGSFAPRLAPSLVILVTALASCLYRLLERPNTTRRLASKSVEAPSRTTKGRGHLRGGGPYIEPTSCGLLILFTPDRKDTTGTSVAAPAGLTNGPTFSKARVLREGDVEPRIQLDRDGRI